MDEINHKQERLHNYSIINYSKLHKICFPTAEFNNSLKIIDNQLKNT